MVDEEMERALEWANMVVSDGSRHDFSPSERSAARALLAEHARAERLAQLDREAATHVETLICMRTGFTGEPPYVGWKGLGLALTEALDERDECKAQVATLREALEALDRSADDFFAFLKGEYSFPHSEDHDDHNVYEFLNAVRKARAAIAKATVDQATPTEG